MKGGECFMLTDKTLKILGWVATGVGAVASIAAGVIAEKKQESTIKKETVKAVAEVMKGES